MGAWGTALFSDDTAGDVRDSYVDLVGDGLTGPEATKALLHEWSNSLNDPDESPVFWLALAETNRIRLPSGGANQFAGGSSSAGVERPSRRTVTTLDLYGMIAGESTLVHRPNLRMSG
jgi:hypothetical protein